MAYKEKSEVSGLGAGTFNGLPRTGDQTTVLSIPLAQFPTDIPAGTCSAVSSGPILVEKFET